MSAEPIDTLTLPDRQVWTLEDLVSLPDDGHRYEIVDGSLLMAPAPTVEAPFPVEVRPADLVGPRRRG
jgi:hypothetical protein